MPRLLFTPGPADGLDPIGPADLCRVCVRQSERRPLAVPTGASLRHTARISVAEMPAGRNHPGPGFLAAPRLAAVILPEHNRKHLRSFDPVERPAQRELRRRTVNSWVFAGEDARLRLAIAVLVEIETKWISDTLACFRRENQDA